MKTEWIVQSKDNGGKWYTFSGAFSEEDGISRMQAASELVGYRGRQWRLVRRETTETVITEGGAK